MYSKEVLKHFKEPKNLGRMKNPDAVGEVGNIACGDVMRLYLKIGKNKKGKEVVEDVKFETFGCVAAIATSSMITELAKGKTMDQVMNLDKEKILKELGGLPPIKVHCSVLAVDALSEAIYNYLKKKGRKVPEEIEKKHRRIKNTKRVIEEKYEEWVKKEKELLNHEEE